jgi:hypothetical protein
MTGISRRNALGAGAGVAAALGLAGAGKAVAVTPAPAALARLLAEHERTHGVRRRDVARGQRAVVPGAGGAGGLGVPGAPRRQRDPRTALAPDRHRVALTGDGEVMTGFARSILDQQDLALRYFARSELRGRLGVSEDLVPGRHPDLGRPADLGRCAGSVSHRGLGNRCGATEFNGASAGLGVEVFAGSVRPDGLVPLTGLPDPGAVVFALTSRRRVTDGPVVAAELISSHHWAVGPQRTV